jgi:hypothetical protein
LDQRGMNQYINRAEDQPVNKNLYEFLFITQQSPSHRQFVF